MNAVPPPATAQASWQLDAMRRVALVVAGASGPDLFGTLVAEVARALPAAAVMVSVFADDSRATLRVLAMHEGGQPQPGFDYPVAGSPCAQVVGREYRYLAGGVHAQVDPHSLFAAAGFDAYAAFPLNDSHGRPLGVLAALDRVPIAHGDAEHAEVVLKVVAGRLAAELERQQALESLRRSEANYRGIFEAAPDSIFVHDWQTFAIRDLNRTAEETLGYTRAELLAIEPAALMSGEPPYDLEHAFAHLQQAKLGRCPPFEWRTRLKDGRLKWQEVHLKPVVIDGAPQILAFTRDISERKAAEEQLRASEAQYRAIFDASADALMLWDSQLVRVDVNAAHERIFGFAREDVVGRAFEGLPYPDEYVQPRLERVRRALAGEASRVELEALRKDGTRILTELRTIPFVHGGEPHVLQIARDITERKAAEARLRASEEQYRAIFEAAADALILWNSRYERVDVNPAYERLFGWSRAEVLGRSFEVFSTDPAYARPRRDLVTRALAGETCRAELQFVRKDGRLIDTEIHTIPFRHRGEPHVLAIARDITERKAAAEKLRLSEEQYRAIFNASADALTLWDSQMRRVDINTAYERMYGWSREDVIGKGYEQLPFGEAYYAPRQALVRRALAGEACSAELESIRKDGRRIPTEIHAVPFSHRGEPHVLVIGRDLTERRAAEDERARLEEQLRQAQKMEAIGQLTGGIAHDFNNILTSVLGYIVLAQERALPLDDARLQRQLAQAQQAGERARDLVAQMLAFARRRSGRRQLLAPQPLLLETVELLRPTLPSSVLLEVAAPAPALPAVEVDPVQMGQVLMNLLINARDAVAGAGRVRVGLGCAGGGWRCAACAATVTHGRWVEIDVADDGCGIAPEALRRVFDPFFTTKPAGHGTGMGLAMVHGIVHDHGGHVVVDTRVGKGTTFRVLLPAAASGTPTADQAAPSAPAAAAATLAGRVLVVEDDAQVGAYLAEQLDAWGLEVVLHADAREALRWLHDHAGAVQLVVTDLTMPHLSGLELARRATRLRPGLPVLLVSADLAAADAHALATSGVRAALAKPIDAQALRRAVTEALAASV